MSTEEVKNFLKPQTLGERIGSIKQYIAELYDSAMALSELVGYEDAEAFNLVVRCARTINGIQGGVITKEHAVPAIEMCELAIENYASQQKCPKSAASYETLVDIWQDTFDTPAEPLANGNPVGSDNNSSSGSSKQGGALSGELAPGKRTNKGGRLSATLTAKSYYEAMSNFKV